MTRPELLEAASSKLTEAALLLLAAGEEHLAADAEQLAEWANFDPDKPDALIPPTLN